MRHEYRRAVGARQAVEALTALLSCAIIPPGLDSLQAKFSRLLTLTGVPAIQPARFQKRMTEADAKTQEEIPNG